MFSSNLCGLLVRSFITKVVSVRFNTVHTLETLGGNGLWKPFSCSSLKTFYTKLGKTEATIFFYMNIINKWTHNSYIQSVNRKLDMHSWQKWCYILLNPFMSTSYIVLNFRQSQNTSWHMKLLICEPIEQLTLNMSSTHSIVNKYNGI